MAKAIPFTIWRAARLALEAESKAASDAWRAIPGVSSGPMGLTPDCVKASPEYRAAKARYDRAHSALARHNKGNAAHCRALAKERAAP